MSSFQIIAQKPNVSIDRPNSRKARLLLASAAIAALVSAASHDAYADSTWVGGTSSDYTNTANWNTDPTGQTVIINTTGNTGAFPVISSTPAFAPVDWRIGTGATGRVDQTAGTAGTGDGNWFFLGYSAGTATFNLANTAATGGTYTGFGQGSGSFNVGGPSQNGNLFIGLDSGTTSTVNVNTTGTLAAGTVYVGGAQASHGTLNVDNGTVTVQGELQVCGVPFNNPGNDGTGTLNISGGSVTANILTMGRGIDNGSRCNGTTNITGGTINTQRWLTLGFAGTATDTGTLNNSGGTINVNIANGGGVLEMAVYDTATAVFNQNSGALNLDNNAPIGFGNGGNHSGTATFTQNGGTVTFYSDTGTTAGGTGGVVLGVGGSTGTYVYALNGGTLTTPSISQSATGATGVLKLNGGTLRPTAASTTFVTGLTSAVVQSGGAKIDTNGFNVTIPQTLTHDGALGAAADGGLTKAGSGTLTLSGTNTYTGTTTIAGGTLQAGLNNHTQLLSGSAGVNFTSPTGKLILDYTGGSSPVSTVKATLGAEYAAHTFGTTGQIRSSTLTGSQTIGYGDDGTSAVTVRVTLPGDANLDGVVNFSDFLLLQANFGGTGTTFGQGNFNYDGQTDFSDFLLLQSNFGSSINGTAVTVTASEVAAMSAFANSVPEPTSLALAGIGAAGLLNRRRRSN